MADTEQTKTSLYISRRHRQTWIRFCQEVDRHDRSDWVMRAIGEKLDRDSGRQITQTDLRQALREELQAALRNVQAIEQPSSDQEYDNLADKILGGIDF
jgi:hypothetical protein